MKSPASHKHSDTVPRSRHLKSNGAIGFQHPITRHLLALADGQRNAWLDADSDEFDPGVAKAFNELAAALDISAAAQQSSQLALKSSDLYFAVAEIEHFGTLRKRIGRELAADLLSNVCERIEASSSSCAIVRVGRTSLEFFFEAPSAKFAREALNAVRDQVARPVNVEGLSISLSVTIGATPVSDETDSDAFFETAAIAMAEASEKKCGVLVLSQDEVAKHEQADMYDRFAILHDLKSAMSDDTLQLFYQPKLDARTDTVMAVEGLLRCQHPEHGMLATNKVIQIAEETGAIDELTRWVVKRALADQQALHDLGHPLRVFVNLSGMLLSDRVFADWLLDECAGQEKWIGLEITETAIINDPEIGISHIQEFAEAGMAIAIDDYGSGLSSLEYLKRLPATELKIDRSFISGLTTSHRDPLLVRSSIDLAHALEMQVTAEGVDDSMSLSLLRVMGCDMIQGFLVSEALPLTELAEFLVKGFDSSEFAQPVLASQRK